MIYFIRLFIEPARLCLMFTYHSFISMNQICNRAALNCIIKKQKKQIIRISNDGIIHNHLVRICLYAWISVIFSSKKKQFCEIKNLSRATSAKIFSDHKNNFVFFCTPKMAMRDDVDSSVSIR